MALAYNQIKGNNSYLMVEKQTKKQTQQNIEYI